MLFFVSVAASVLIDQVTALWLAEYPASQSFLSVGTKSTALDCCCPEAAKAGQGAKGTGVNFDQCDGGSTPNTYKRQFKSSEQINKDCTSECDNLAAQDRILLKLGDEEKAPKTLIGGASPKLLVMQAVIRTVINMEFAIEVFDRIRALQKELEASLTDDTTGPFASLVGELSASEDNRIQSGASKGLRAALAKPDEDSLEIECDDENLVGGTTLAGATGLLGLWAQIVNAATSTLNDNAKIVGDITKLQYLKLEITKKRALMALRQLGEFSSKEAFTKICKSGGKN